MTLAVLRASFEKLLTAQEVPIHRLIIFFAGHGLIREAEEGLWLLSDWGKELRAVAVEALKRRLFQYGLSQIAIFADACRYLPANMDAADLTADAVLGRAPIPNRTVPAVDKFIAAQDGKGTIMIPGTTPEEDRCLFSRVLLECLWGSDANAFSKVITGKITSRSLAAYLTSQVPAIALRYGRKIEPTVSPTFPEGDDIYFGESKLPPPPAFPPWPPPLARASSSVARVVPTDRETPKSPPAWVEAHTIEDPVAYSSRAALDDRYAPPPFEPAARAPPPRSSRRSLTGIVIAGLAVSAALLGIAHGTHALFRRFFPGISRFDLLLGAAPVIAMLAVLLAIRMTNRRRTKNKLVLPQRGDLRTIARADTGVVPEKPARRSGLIIEGQTIKALWTMGNLSVDAHSDTGCWIDGKKDAKNLAMPVPVVVELSGGLWAATTALPQSLGSLVIKPRGVETLLFRKAGAQQSTSDVVKRIINQMQDESLHAGNAASYLARLRNTHYADPVLGVITAYLYDSVGDTDSILRIASNFLQKGQPLPYDIALLAQLDGEWRDKVLWVTVPVIPARQPRNRAEEAFEWTWRRLASTEGFVGGLWPWMRQGWIYLDDAIDDGSSLVVPGMREITRYLQAARFATLNEVGARRLINLLELERTRAPAATTAPRAP